MSLQASLAVAYAVLSSLYILYITRDLSKKPRALGVVGGIAMQWLIAYVIFVLPLNLAIVFFAANVACWAAMYWSEHAFGVVMLGKQ
jgi:hypothetical protein